MMWGICLQTEVYCSQSDMKTNEFQCYCSYMSGSLGYICMYVDGVVIKKGTRRNLNLVKCVKGFVMYKVLTVLKSNYTLHLIS